VDAARFTPSPITARMDYASLGRYVDVVEHGPDAPVETLRTGTDSMRVKAACKPGRYYWCRKLRPTGDLRQRRQSRFRRTRWVFMLLRYRTGRSRSFAALRDAARKPHLGLSSRAHHAFHCVAGLVFTAKHSGRIHNHEPLGEIARHWVRRRAALGERPMSAGTGSNNPTAK